MKSKFKDISKRGLMLVMALVMMVSLVSGLGLEAICFP